MSASERGHVFSFEEYVALAENSSARIELWEGAILDMSGGSPRHSAICNNLGRILGNQLRGTACRVFDANLRVRSIAANRATFADVTVVCGTLERDPADRTRQTVLNPVVLVEVLSPTTETDDRGPKLDCYKSIASVRTIVLVAQDRPWIVVHHRGADGTWVEATTTRGEALLPGVECMLSLADVYENLPDE